MYAKTMKLVTLLIPAVAAVPRGAPETKALKTVLSTFDGNKATTQDWRATNDPVMGGISESSVKIAGGALDWSGEVKIVPKLQAPGFCTATTGGYHQQPDKFPDISAAEGLLITARNTMQGGLSSFKVSMVSSVRSSERDGQFEGRFNTTVSKDFRTYFVPFSAMSQNWRGEPEGGAPTTAQLKAITGLGFNQDGVAGKFNIEVQEIAAGSPGGGGVAAKTLDLVTFKEGDATNYKWSDLNDPVMGGRSTSTFKIEGGRGIFDGVCRIVPSLKAPGFCNAEARPSFDQRVPDASAFIEGGLEIELVSTGNLTQFKAAFGNRAEHDFGSYKADFVVSAGPNTVRIPFTSFSNKWSSSTGEPTVKCSPEHKSVCPTAHSLATIGSIGVWAEGYAGQFHLEITAIRAYLEGPAPGPAPGPGPAKAGVDLWTVQSKTAWHLTNDPVMGGRSHSTIHVDTADQVAIFEGECKIVPKLSAPGFCDAETSAPSGKSFPSAVQYDGIEITLRQTVEGGLLDYKQSWGPRGTGNFGSYKAGFKLQPTTEFQTVFIPWGEYTNKWSDFTGGCTDHGAVCCSAEHPEVCPTAAAKAKIETIGIWAEGTAGKFNLEIRSIRAVKTAPSVNGGACAATEFCCPDAKHCLTPVPDKTCNATTPCATGETCCPLTKICVKVGAACKSPCADPKSYCCPDAKHCLTPTNPGHLCDPTDKTACPATQVCCPLIKECVSVGAACNPSHDKPDWAL